ncbi:MAG: hypothetical protein JXB34_10820 [Bacteroidales bacterium]|nr:hypothetical protein [Bacteroidales bacterium]
METIKRLLLLGILAAVFSCTPAYIPNVVNTPLLTEKNDLNLATYTGTSGFDLQGSYALTDNIGLMINSSMSNRANDSTDNYHRHAFFEVAPGYYTNYGRIGVVEVYGGYGHGWVDSYYSNSYFLSYSKANVSRFFIQPGMGLTTHIFDGIASVRLVYVSIFQDNISDYGVFFEPVLTGKLGYKYLKFVGQMGFSMPVLSKEINFEYQPFLVSFGVQINLGALVKSASQNNH